MNTASAKTRRANGQVSKVMQSPCTCILLGFGLLYIVFWLTD